MIKKKFRVKKRNDFQRVFENGFVFSSFFLRIKFIENNLEYSRISVVVPKKNIRFANKRNRLKRQIGEIVRLEYNRIKSGYDILIFYKNKKENILYEDLEKNFISVLNEAKLLKKI
jgi:ribonuclease P protein component